MTEQTRIDPDSAVKDVPPRDLTLIAGTPGVIGTAIGAAMRQGRNVFDAAGVSLMLQRQANDILRPAMSEPTPAARVRLMTQLGLEGRDRAVLCDLAALGPSLVGAEFYPDVEDRAARLAALFPHDRLHLVISIAPLPFFFSHTPALRGPVRRLRWHQLYEMSWADRIDMIAAVLPYARITILTPWDAAMGGGDTLVATFGVPGLPSPHVMTHAMLTEDGRAALAQDASDLPSLIERHGRLPDRATLADMGIDPSLEILLGDRFAEDIARLDAMPEVEVL